MRCSIFRLSKLNRKTCALAALFGLLLGFSACATLAQGSLEKQKFSFELKSRVNAHGDEFNALAKSSDGQRLITVTEKGELIVWNLAQNRVEKTLHQPSPLHLVASLANSREFVAAGAYHIKPAKGTVRKWNVETGESVELPGLDPESTPLALTAETQTGVIALTVMQGKVLVWDAQTNKRLADWTVNGVPISAALVGRELYVATVDQGFLQSEEGEVRESAILKFNVDTPQQAPVEFLSTPGRACVELDVSPDYRLLLAQFQSREEDRKIVVLDPQSKRELLSFVSESTFWVDSTRLMVFDWLDPIEIVEVSLSEPAKTVRKIERLESDTRGRAFDLSGHVSNADGSKAWASYSKGPGLLEFDLTKNKIKTLISGLSGAYALSVLTPDGQKGEVLTGGADGYVRLWKFEDLSLIKEYKVAKPDYFVSDAVLVPGSRRAVVTIMSVDAFKPDFDMEKPQELILVDLETGQQRKLFDAYSLRTRMALISNELVYADLGRIKFASVEGVKSKREFNIAAAIMQTTVSANKRWLAVLDYNDKLNVFDLKTGRKRTMKVDTNFGGPAVITNDGRYVYFAREEGTLVKWDTVAAKTTTTVFPRLSDAHSRVDFMTLANNDRWIIATGNHRDVGIFDRKTLELLFYMPNNAAVNFVERVWTNGERLIMTTDTGVMHLGSLKETRSAN